MVSQNDILLLEGIIIEHSGPMGKFVIKKSIADMGMDPGMIVDEHRMKLVNMVLERAIFDREKWPAIKKAILSAWGEKGNA